MVDKETLLVAIDFGGSGTKAIGSPGPDGTPQSCLVYPEQCEVRRDSLDSLTHAAVADPENRIWVGTKDGRHTAIGSLAREHFQGNAKLSSLKGEIAVPKALGILWLFKERFQLPASFRTVARLLLPPGEFSNRTRLVADLQEAASQFETPSGTLNIEFDDLSCLPEGGGIYAGILARNATLLRNNEVAIVMLGYRNVSQLLSRRGIVGSGISEELGMVRLVRGIASRMSGLAENRIAEALANWQLTQNDRSLAQLCRSRSRSARRAELGELKQAFAAAREDYLYELKSFFEERLPMSCDTVVWCGGTAQFLRNELGRIVPEVESQWHGNLQVPEEVDTAGLKERLCDAYGIYEQLALDSSCQVAS